MERVFDRVYFFTSFFLKRRLVMEIFISSYLLFRKWSEEKKNISQFYMIHGPRINCSWRVIQQNFLLTKRNETNFIPFLCSRKRIQEALYMRFDVFTWVSAKSHSLQCSQVFWYTEGGSSSSYIIALSEYIALCNKELAVRGNFQRWYIQVF